MMTNEEFAKSLFWSQVCWHAAIFFFVAASLGSAYTIYTQNVEIRELEKQQQCGQQPPQNGV